MSSVPHPLDLLATPIENGTTLIEASAGTGKTYSVAGLVLRLLLERHVDGIGNVLVMTFTNAATAELTARIRSRVAAAAALFRGENVEADEFLRGLLATHSETGPAILARALRDLDDLTVVTIHGFCSRMLDQYALETSTRFDADYGPDDNVLLERAAERFWRAEIYPRGGLLAAALIENKRTPTSFLDDYRRCARHPGIEILPEAAPLDDAVAALERAVAAAATVWSTDEVTSFFRGVTKFIAAEGKALAAGYTRIVAAADALFRDGRASGLGAALALAPARIRAGVGKQSKSEKAHLASFEGSALAGSLATLGAAVDALDHSLRVAFITGLDTILDQEKREATKAFYDDLLRDLHTALSDDRRAGALRNAADRQFQAVLVDEFQDTDVRQYEIFERLFRNARLFYVGDPKQSIYAFRGADVFAYLRAKRAASRELTLGRNFRSDAPLIQAVNALFSRTTNAFSIEGIPFREAGFDQAPQTKLGGDDRAVLQWLWIDAPASTAGARTAEAVAAAAAEIVRLVSADSSTRLGDRNVEPRDIAVLVRKNVEAEQMRAALELARVPAVVSQAGNVLDSDEALELGTLLTAVLAPGHAPSLRAALATRVIGGDAAAIAALETDSAGWEKHVERFAGLATIWRRRGFVAMANEMLAKTHGRARLLAMPRGARRLTNLLHLVELVQQAADEHHLGPEGALLWLARARGDTERRRGDTTELRLESDDDAVQIITIHKSKGLEFPIVFCPTLWLSSDGEKAAKKAAVVHLADDRVVYHVDPASEPDVASAVRNESLGEEVRIAYVALTRAKHRCYVVAGAHDGGSVLDHLLGKADDDPIEAALRSFCEDHPTLTRIMSAATEPGTRRSPARTAAQRSELEARVFATAAGASIAPRRITSFSSLRTAAAAAAPELPDHRDPQAGGTTGTEPARGIFAFARGARAGTCLHDVLEHCDLGRTEAAETRELVAGTLRRHGLDRPDAHDGVIDAVAVVMQMLADVAAAPLPSAGFSLAAVAGTSRLSEWQFHMPVSALSQRGIGAVLAAHARSPFEAAYAARVIALGDRAIEGFLAGYVDCAFVHDSRWYVVDWKSNHLGNRRADYGAGALATSMAEHHYILQYHLYLVALHRYLGQRLRDYDYDSDVGGVYYAFLRGMHAGSSDGWYTDKPSRDVIDALDDVLAGGSRR